MMIKIFIRFTFLIIFFLGSPIWSKNSEITIANGPAGTGKTYLAVAVALKMLLEKKN